MGFDTFSKSIAEVLLKYGPEKFGLTLVVHAVSIHFVITAIDLIVFLTQ